MKKKEFFKTGYDARGFDIWGRNKNGTLYSDNGLTKDGFNRYGIHYKTHTWWDKEGYDAMGFASHPNFEKIQEKKRKREEIKAIIIQNVKEFFIFVMELIVFIFTEAIILIEKFIKLVYKNRCNIKYWAINLLKVIIFLVLFCLFLHYLKTGLNQRMVEYTRLFNIS